MTYVLLDGVRRAKAAQLHGHVTIPAELYDASGSLLLGTFAVRLDDLRSPRAEILRQSQRQDDRWLAIFQAARQFPLPFPPVRVRHGSRGTRLGDITFDFGMTP